MKYLLTACFLIAAAGAQTRSHVEAVMTLHLDASPAAVLPLFGPVREGEWAPGWNPTILYPADRSQKSGSVFTTGKPGKEAVWIMTAYDEAALRVSYVIVDPGVTAEQLDIVLKLASGGKTEAVLTHRWTALSDRADARIADWAAEFPAQHEHWEHAINARLQELIK